MLTQEELSYVSEYIAWCEKLTVEELQATYWETGFGVEKAIENRKKFRHAVTEANKTEDARWRNILMRIAAVHYKISLSWMRRAEASTIKMFR
jgi:hypothetical protein